MQAAGGVDAFPTEEQPARTISGGRSLPAACEPVAPARPWSRASCAAECELDWTPQYRRRVRRAGRPDVRKACEHSRLDVEPRERVSTTQEANERRVEPATRLLIRGPVQGDTRSLRVVARWVCGKVVAPHKEEPQVGASWIVDPTALAQQPVDGRFPSAYFHPAAIRADEQHSCEALRLGGDRNAQREHPEQSQSKLRPHMGSTTEMLG